MTTYIEFTPSSNANFQFQAQLDNNIYNVVTTWALYGSRYYFNVYSTDGTLIVSKPMVGSPPPIALKDIKYSYGTAIATTVVPHNYKIGSVVYLRINNCSPLEYNGLFLCSIINSTSFSYKVSNISSDAVYAGICSYDINIVGGYFDSSIVWRPDNNQIEINQ